MTTEIMMPTEAETEQRNDRDLDYKVVRFESRAHRLTVRENFFSKIITGERTHEITFDKKTYRKWDYLYLTEIGQETGEATGRACRCQITNVQSGSQASGLREGFVCLSLKVLNLYGI